MSQPITVSIPHRLGRDEATRRLQTGLGRARTDFSKFLTISEENWTGNHLTFKIAAMGQQASGTIDVEDDHVKLEVALPWLLAKIADKILPKVKQAGVAMLERKP